MIVRNGSVLTCDAFKAATTQPPKHKHFTFLNKEARPTHLALVDDTLVALDNYYRENNINNTQEQGLLNAVVRACQTVIAKYPSADKMGVFDVQVKNLLDNLMRNAKKASINLEGGDQQKARNYFEENKTKGKEKDAKGLAKGYDHERTNYVQNNKKCAFAGSPIVDNSVETYLQYVQEAKKNGGHTVDYLSKADRLKWLVMVQGGILTHPNGRLVKTPNLYTTGLYDGSRESDMWSMDRYGNLFYKGIGGKEAGRDGSYFNHSSFNAGNDVICAGTMVVNEGKLAYIDNDSGHYKPTTVDLKRALEMLYARGGVDYCDQVCVFFKFKGEGYTRSMKKFLETPDGDPLADGGSDWDNKQNVELKLSNKPVDQLSIGARQVNPERHAATDQNWERARGERKEIDKKLKDRKTLTPKEQYFWDNCLKDNNLNAWSTVSSNWFALIEKSKTHEARRKKNLLTARK